MVIHNECMLVHQLQYSGFWFLQPKLIFQGWVQMRFLYETFSCALRQSQSFLLRSFHSVWSPHPLCSGLQQQIHSRSKSLWLWVKSQWETWTGGNSLRGKDHSPGHNLTKNGCWCRLSLAGPGIVMSENFSHGDHISREAQAKRKE